MSTEKRSRGIRFVICVMLAFPLMTEARVMDDFSQCPGHFYQDAPPNLAGIQSHGLKCICQTYNSSERFATLYNVTARIPIYSAYQLHNLSCRPEQRRSIKWYVEPQLVNTANDPEMAPVPRGQTNVYRQHQATDKDYTTTGYDRGHLNPNGHHCNADNRTATFTLTNAVPQDPCFNEVHWVEMETHAYKSLKAQCMFPGARKYIVTGTALLEQSRAIPQGTDRDPGTSSNDLNRVEIPSHMWSAVCCDSSEALIKEDRKKGWSYAYYGINQASSYIQTVPVTELNDQLVEWYNIPVAKIFRDIENTRDCEFDKNRSKEVKESAGRIALRQNLRNLATNHLVIYEVTHILLEIEVMLEDDDGPSHPKYPKFDVSVNADIVMQAERTKTNYFLYDLEEHGLTCDVGSITVENVISSGGELRAMSSDNGRRGMSSANEVTQCRVDEVADRGSITTSGRLCRVDHQCAKHGNTYYSWCYVDDRKNYGRCCDTPCEENREAGEQTCFDGLEIQSCTPHRTVDTTLNGALCRNNYQCGTHGRAYYHCYTDADKRETCCATYHSCGRHGENYDWCYTGGNSWERCTPPVIIN